MIETHVFPTRILIVDDNAAARDSLAVALRYTDDSFLVSTAETGAEALERLRDEPFDVVLCDLVLGGDLNGIAVTRAIESDHGHVRTVVFTGQETGESKEEVLDAGAFLPVALCRGLAAVGDGEILIEAAEVVDAQGDLLGRLQVAGSKSESGNDAQGQCESAHGEVRGTS